MPTYLIAFKQTADTWAKLAANPADRRESLGPVIEKMGGKLLEVVPLPVEIRWRSS
jgi:hypothetical protein